MVVEAARASTHSPAFASRQLLALSPRSARLFQVSRLGDGRPKSCNSTGDLPGSPPGSVVGAVVAAVQFAGMALWSVLFPFFAIIALASMGIL